MSEKIYEVSNRDMVVREIPVKTDNAYGAFVYNEGEDTTKVANQQPLWLPDRVENLEGFINDLQEFLAESVYEGQTVVLRRLKVKWTD